MSKDEIKEGYVFNIQRYSVHDGPGIRTTIFLKGCSLQCYWCQNPESQKLYPEIMYYEEKCTKCGKCLEVCPSGAVRLSGDVMDIDRDKCTGCGKCAEVCLNGARRIVGSIMTVDDILKVVLKDLSYYKNSNGGITISGGEPFMQPEFTKAILGKCKEHGLHTAVETAGYVPWENISSALDYIDLVLFDIKHFDPIKHKSGTGHLNYLIIENAMKIAVYKPLCIRVPLIPGFNDSPEIIKKISELCSNKELCSAVTNIELQAYNKMGEGKYKRLGRRTVRLETQDEEQVHALNLAVLPPGG